MILLDATLLLYAKLADMPLHEMSRLWLERELTGPGRVGMPWESLTAFLRISTNPRIFPMPLGPSEAWEQVEEWLALPNVWIPQPVDLHANILGGLIRDTGATGKRLPDAHLAALAIGHGLTLCTADTDFRVFRGLKILNPTVP